MSDTRELEARLRLQPEDAGGPSRMDMLRERIEAADALAAMRWQPTETAPKDGTRVLVWNRGCGYWVASFRLPVRGEPQCEGHYVHEWRDGGGRWATPTKWMPLPAAPKE